MSADRRPITLVISSMDGGGAQRAVAKLASGLADAGHEVDLVLGRAEGPYLAELSPRVQVVDLRARRFALALLPLARYLRRARPLAVFSALDYVNVVTVLARRVSGVSTRLVVSERNTLSVGARHGRGRRTRWMPVAVRWAYPRADAIVAVSRGVADDLVALCGLDPASVQVLNNPVVTPALERMRGEPVPHPWLQDPVVPVVLTVGRLVEQKDHASLIEAFAAVRKTDVARLLVLGDGPLRPELERQVAELGLSADVDLPGFCANPYPAMAAARAYVLSSRWEGSPGALIEAMACGARVIATDCPSGPREVLADGTYGRLVPVGDVAALATGIRDALSGALEPPPPEGWLPYEQTTSVRACLDLLGVVPCDD